VSEDTTKRSGEKKERLTEKKSLVNCTERKEKLNFPFYSFFTGRKRRVAIGRKGAKKVKYI
jgi:hypothetical protein